MQNVLASFVSNTSPSIVWTCPSKIVRNSFIMSSLESKQAFLEDSLSTELTEDATADLNTTGSGHEYSGGRIRRLRTVCSFVTVLCI